MCIFGTYFFQLDGHYYCYFCTVVLELVFYLFVPNILVSLDYEWLFIQVGYCEETRPIKFSGDFSLSKKVSFQMNQLLVFYVVMSYFLYTLASAAVSSALQISESAE